MYFAFFQFVAAMTAIAAWITHVVSCIKAGSIGLLLLGAFIPPIGVIHGWMVWLGAV